MRKKLYYIVCGLAIVIGLFIVWLIACTFVDLIEIILSSDNISFVNQSGEYFLKIKGIF